MYLASKEILPGQINDIITNCDLYILWFVLFCFLIFSSGLAKNGFVSLINSSVKYQKV